MESIIITTTSERSSDDPSELQKKAAAKEHHRLDNNYYYSNRQSQHSNRSDGGNVSNSNRSNTTSHHRSGKSRKLSGSRHRSGGGSHHSRSSNGSHRSSESSRQRRRTESEGSTIMSSKHSKDHTTTGSSSSSRRSQDDDDDLNDWRRHRHRHHRSHHSSSRSSHHRRDRKGDDGEDDKDSDQDIRGKRRHRHHHRNHHHRSKQENDTVTSWGIRADKEKQDPPPPPPLEANPTTVIAEKEELAGEEISEEDRNHSRRNRRCWIIVLLGIVVLIVIIALGVHFGSTKGDDDGHNPTAVSKCAAAAAGLTLVRNSESFEYIWYMDIKGSRRHPNGDDVQEELRKGIEAIWSCGQDEKEPSYLSVDVNTVELISNNNPNDDNDDVSNYFVAEIHLNGTTRYQELIQEQEGLGGGGLLWKEYQDDDAVGNEQRKLSYNYIRRLEEEPPNTSLPTTRAQAVQALNDYYSGNAYSVEVLDVVEMLPLVASNADDDDEKLVTFSMSMQVDGSFADAEENEENSMQQIVDYVIASYNYLKAFGGTCDTSCLKLLSGNATIDPSSVELANNNNNTRRKLDDEVQEINASTLSPSPTVSISPSKNVNGTTTTASPTEPFVPTVSPTQSPTFRGVDRFTIRFNLQGICRGCENNVAMFNQVVGRRRTLMLSDLQKSHLDSFMSRQLQQQEDEEDECLCPVDAPEGKPTEDLFLSLLRDRAPFPFIEDYVDIEETEFFQCQPNREKRLSSTLSIEFEGKEIPQDPNEIALFEEYVGWAYNKSAENVCDIYSTTLTSVKYLEIAEKDEEPSRRSLDETNNNDDDPSTMPSSSATPSTYPTVPFVPTVAPTLRPTFRGVDRFSLVFEIVGGCNGCPDDYGFFNQVILRRNLLEAAAPTVAAFQQPITTRTIDQSSEKVIRQGRTLQEKDQCSCDKELFKGAVPYEYFEDALLQKADQLGFSGIEKIQEVVQGSTYSPTTSASPSVVVEESSAPSESPVADNLETDEGITQNPTTSIHSQSPTFSPRNVPPDDPTVIPSGNPTVSDPSPSPSVRASNLPTQSPSPGPSIQPTSSPSGNPNHYVQVASYTHCQSGSIRGRNLQRDWLIQRLYVLYCSP